MEERRNERDLVIQFIKAREKIDNLKESLKTAQSELDTLEALVLELLESKSATATAKFEGIGYLQVQKPRLFASVTQDNLDQLLVYLDKKGRNDLIKTSVLPQTLSAYTRELIENGEEVPSMINYYLKPSVRIYNK